MKKILLLLLALMPLASVQAQLSLAPTAVYIDKNGIGNLFVTNNSGVPQEITINFQFGYSDQDENGVLIMQYADSANKPVWGLDSYIKAFPRTFILPPGQQQIVRLQIRTPKGLSPGTYFTRLKVGSSGQVADVGTEQGDGGVATRINMRFEQVIVAFYKNGSVSTGVNVDRFEAKADSTTLTLDTWYRTTGNSPFLGAVSIVVKGSNGKVVAEGRQTVAMYFTGKRRFKFRLDEKLNPGRYDVEMRFETSRNDIPSDDLVQGQPYTFKSSFQAR